jgi:hypothetical protein
VRVARAALHEHSDDFERSFRLIRFHGSTWPLYKLLCLTKHYLQFTGTADECQVGRGP